MQGELDPDRFVIVGVNEAGYESGNESFCDGRDVPWLQDTSEDDVWGTWSVTYRDVLVLDAENRLVAIYNLTANDLGEQDLYDELLGILEGAE